MIANGLAAGIGARRAKKERQQMMDMVDKQNSELRAERLRMMHIDDDRRNAVRGSLSNIIRRKRENNGIVDNHILDADTDNDHRLARIYNFNKSINRKS